jgi:Transcriptional regulator PadR-like family
MTFWQHIVAWWRRPSAEARVLAALLVGEQSGQPRMQGKAAQNIALVASVYTTLHRLEDAGLVESMVDPLLTVHTVGCRPLERRRYWLTNEGRRRAKQVEPW